MRSKTNIQGLVRIIRPSSRLKTHAPQSDSIFTGRRAGGGGNRPARYRSFRKLRRPSVRRRSSDDPPRKYVWSDHSGRAMSARSWRVIFNLSEGGGMELDCYDWIFDFVATTPHFVLPFYHQTTGGIKRRRRVGTFT